MPHLDLGNTLVTVFEQIGLLIPVRVIWLLGDIGICYRGFGSAGEMAIGLMVYRGFYFRAFDLSGILQSGFWFIGEFVIGVLVYRGFGYRAFDLSGFCYRANGYRAFGYRPYVVLPDIYPTLTEIELSTCSVPKACRFTRPQWWNSCNLKNFVSFFYSSTEVNNYTAQQTILLCIAKTL